jgi:hypothetical protein
MKILWICPRFPLPTNDGARLATMALLSELKNAARTMRDNLQLDLVCFYDELPPAQLVNQLKEITQCRELFLLKKNSLLFFGRKFLRRLLFRVCHWKTPLTVAPFADATAQNCFQTWSQKTGPWDFTVLDGLHARQILASPVSKHIFGKLIYRAHNVESRLWKQACAATKNPILRFILSFESRLFASYEKKTCLESALVVPVSDIDQQHFINDFDCPTPQSIPIGFAFPEQPLDFPIVKGNDVQLLFVGRLDWPPNRDGLRWFLDRVWSVISKNPVRLFHLTLIGSGNSDWLQPYLQSSQIELLRNVAELRPYYERTHLSLIPLFMGSGTRVKAIESGSMARSFISTSIGVEGLSFQSPLHYQKLETAEEWIDFLLHFKHDQAQEMGKRLWQEAHDQFDQRTLATKFISALLSV